MENIIDDVLKVNQEKVHLKDPEKTYHTTLGEKLALITKKTMEQLSDNIRFGKLKDRVNRYNSLVDEYKKVDKKDNTEEEIEKAKESLSNLGVEIKYRELKNEFLHSPEYKKLSVPARLVDRVKLLFYASKHKAQIKEDIYNDLTKSDKVKEDLNNKFKKLFSNLANMDQLEFSELVSDLKANFDHYNGNLKEDFAEEIKKACKVDGSIDKEKLAKRLELINYSFGLDLKLDEPVQEETKEEVKKEETSKANPSLNEILNNNKVEENNKEETVQETEVKSDNVNKENNTPKKVELGSELPEFKTGDPNLDLELRNMVKHEMGKIRESKTKENALPNNTDGERAVNDAAKQMFNKPVQNNNSYNGESYNQEKVKPKEYEEIKFVPQTEIDEPIIRRDYSEYTDYELEKEIERQNETFLRWAFIAKGMTEKKFLIDLQERSEAGFIYRKRKLLEMLKVNPGASLTQEDVNILRMNSSEFNKYIKANEPKIVPKELYLNSRYTTEYFDQNKDEFAKANALGEEILKRERIKEAEKELIKQQKEAEKRREEALLRAKAIAREAMINRLILKYGGFFDDPRLVDKLNDNAVDATIKSLKDSNLYESFKGAAIQNYHRILAEQQGTTKEVKKDHEKVIEDTEKKYGSVPYAERNSNVARQLAKRKS